MPSSALQTSFSTTDDNTCQPLTAALPLPTDLSFTIQRRSASPEIGRRHRQQRRQPKARQGTTIRGRDLVQCAPVIPDGIKGASGSARETCAVLGPPPIAAPQLQGALVPPCFTFSSGSPLNAEVGQQAMEYKLSQHDDDLANAFSAFKGLSLCNDHPGSSATAVEVSSLDTAPSDVLGPQQQEAFVPGFTFSSGSLPNAEAEQQAMDSYKPSQSDDLANAFSSAFNRLSLHSDHPGSSAMAVEAASSNTGAVPTSDVLGPQRIVAPQQQALVAPCFTFSSGSPPPIAEAEQQAMDSYEPSQHDANAFSSALNGFSLRNDHPGCSTTAVKTASSDTGAAPANSAAPQQQDAFGSGSPPIAEDLANAFTSAFNGLSMRDDHPGSSSCQGGGHQEQE